MTKITERMTELATPLREMLDEVRQQRAVLKEKDQALEVDERQLTKALRAVDPSFADEQKQATKNGSPKTVSEDTLASVTAWLSVHRNELKSLEEGFSGTSLLKRDDFDVVSLGTLNIALRQLHDRGVLVLHHVSQGGSKWYTVV